MKTIFVVLILVCNIILYIPTYSFQPGGGGGPGGGQGNDPCTGANPPPNCAPIQGIGYLIFVGSLFGIFVIYRKKKKLKCK